MYYRTQQRMWVGLVVGVALGIVAIATGQQDRSTRNMRIREDMQRQKLGLPPVGGGFVAPTPIPTPVPGSIAEEIEKRRIQQEQNMRDLDAMKLEREKLQVERERLELMREQNQLQRQAIQSTPRTSPSRISVTVEDVTTGSRK